MEEIPAENRRNVYELVSGFEDDEEDEEEYLEDVPEELRELVERYGIDVAKQFIEQENAFTTDDFSSLMGGGLGQA